MGGDFGLEVTIPGTLHRLSIDPHLRVILVGHQSKIEAELSRHEFSKETALRLDIHHTPNVVSMDEPVSHAIRTKQDSSMWKSIELVKEGKVDACVSAGNTGALMTISRLVLQTIPGVDRPAIISRFPTLHDMTYVLDLGANVDCSPELLQEFATMGTVMFSALHHVNLPKVALLNIGTEAMKGNEQIKSTVPLLENAPHINYVGFVEPTQLIKGDVDVVVCDGFVGNIMLKSAEGAVKLIGSSIKNAFSKNIARKLLGLLCKPIFADAKKPIDPELNNGASLIGLQGTVVKSHGGASAIGFSSAMDQAILQSRKKVIDRIRSTIEYDLQQDIKDDNKEG